MGHCVVPQDWGVLTHVDAVHVVALHVDAVHVVAVHVIGVSMWVQFAHPRALTGMAAFPGMQVGKRWAEEGYVDPATLPQAPEEGPGRSSAFEVQAIKGMTGFWRWALRGAKLKP